MPDERPPLSTTAYAILGLLSLRPWTGYELTQQAQRSLSFCWPKATSVLYDEPRRLASLGLATVTEEQAGRRTRNRYAITAAGRRALRRWLAEPTAPPRLEIEPMLRMIFVDQADTQAARAVVDSLRAWCEAEQQRGIEILESYRAGTDPFPERRHLNVLNAAFYAAVQRAVLDWTELAGAELSRWDVREPGGAARTTELIDEIVERYLRPAPPGG